MSVMRNVNLPARKINEKYTITPAIADKSEGVLNTLFSALGIKKIDFFKNLIFCIFGLRDHSEIVGGAIWNSTD